MLTIKHTESERNGLFEAWLNDVHVGELTYQRATPERMIIDHTRVFEGTIIPVCSYARNVLTRTNDYKDILA